MPATFLPEDILSTTGGVWIGEKRPDNQHVRLSTDTRTIGFGQWFIPLSGERFNGHDYLAQAFAQGAAGACVSRELAERHPEWQGFGPLIGVDDPLMAYLTLAKAYRQKINPVVVAVTGSSGKTTTKEMLYAVLSPWVPTQKTEKNYNNEVGLAQTLLALEPDTRLLILEMAMRGPEQIRLLTHHGLPDIAAVMNIGPAHIEFFPDGLTGIAKAKCEIFEGLNPEAGLAVVNGDDPELMPVFNACWQGQRHEFRLSDATDIQWLGDDGMRFTYQGVDVYVPLPGDHMVSNALGVLAMAEAAIQRLCGSHRVSLAELASGFASLNRVDGRWQKTPIPCYQNAWVINDAYNANPASLKASLSAFLSTLKPDSGEHCILVLGGMKELGDSSLQYHRDTLDWLASHPQAHLLSLLVLVGSEWPDALPAFIIPAAHVLDAGHVAKLIFGRVDSLENTTVLLKGSRAYKLESILAQLGRPESQTESLAEMSS